MPSPIGSSSRPIAGWRCAAWEAPTQIATAAAATAGTMRESTVSLADPARRCYGVQSPTRVPAIFIVMSPCGVVIFMVPV